MNATDSRTLVATHLGLGDHIWNCGLIREIVKRDGPVTTFSKPHNLKSVRWQFRDIDVEVQPSTEAEMCEAVNAAEKKHVIGFGQWNRGGENVYETMYRNGNVPFSCRWSSFHVERDLKKEAIFADYFAPLTDFIFVHDDPARGMGLTIASKYPIIRADPRHADNLFTWLTLMDRAKEIHAIPSSMMFLADSYPTLGTKTTVHRYTRGVPDTEWPELRFVREVLQ